MRRIRTAFHVLPPGHWYHDLITSVHAVAGYGSVQHVVGMYILLSGRDVVGKTFVTVSLIGHAQNLKPIHTAMPDTTKTGLLCRIWRAVWIGRYGARTERSLTA